MPGMTDGMTTVEVTWTSLSEYEGAQLASSQLLTARAQSPA
jgi:hypothetical protein